jgi:N-acetylglucosamine-6-phosphate deacetylase
METEAAQAAAAPLSVLIARRLYSPEEIEGPVAVVIEGTAIKALWRQTDLAAARERLEELPGGATAALIDLGAWCLAPGYVELHVHGFRGLDITSGSAEDIAAIARALPATGVTSFYPTIATTGRAETLRQVQRIVAVAEQSAEEPASEILGIRLEGPFISRAKKGAQYEPAIRRPDPFEMQELVQAGRGWIRLVDYAPEEDRDGQLLATLVETGLIPCMGHTAATYEQALAAIDGGVRHSAHLFNAMSGLTQRAPGVACALLTDRRVTVEIIADGIHLHPGILKLAVAARGPESVALITDAVAAAGLAEGEYDFVRRKVLVKNGRVQLPDGTLAGSTLTLDRAVRNMVTLAGCRWSEAIRMATLTPAQIAGVASRKGRVAPGADADLLALDEEGCVRAVWTRGQLAYRTE